MNILLFFVFFLFIFRLLFRRLLPWLLRRYINKKMRNMYGSNDAFENDEQTKNTKHFGDIKVDYVPDEEGENKTTSEGEYVDYEEVDNTSKK